MNGDLFASTNSNCLAVHCTRRATVTIRETAPAATSQRSRSCDGHVALLAADFEQPIVERIS